MLHCTAMMESRSEYHRVVIDNKQLSPLQLVQGQLPQSPTQPACTPSVLCQAEARHAGAPWRKAGLDSKGCTESDCPPAHAPWPTPHSRSSPSSDSCTLEASVLAASLLAAADRSSTVLLSARYTGSSALATRSRRRRFWAADVSTSAAVRSEASKSTWLSRPDVAGSEGGEGGGGGESRLYVV